MKQLLTVTIFLLAIASLEVSSNQRFTTESLRRQPRSTVDVRVKEEVDKKMTKIGQLLMAHPNLGKYDGISRGSSTLRETREFLELFDSAYILGDTNEGAVKRFELEVLKNPDKYNTEKGRSEIYTKVRRLFQNKEPSLAVVQKHWEATYTLAKKLVDYKYDDAFKKLEF